MKYVVQMHPDGERRTVAREVDGVPVTGGVPLHAAEMLVEGLNKAGDVELDAWLEFPPVQAVYVDPEWFKRKSAEYYAVMDRLQAVIRRLFPIPEHA